jgi:prepilin peptidase CpaA
MTVDTPTVAVLAVGLIAAAFDIYAKRIPNWLTFGAAALALAYAGFTSGLSGLGTATGGWLMGAALFMPFFLLGGMGAGDVKLIAALAAWLGPWQSVWLAIFAGVAGGVLAVGLALARGYLQTARSNLFLMLMHWRAHGLTPVPGMTLRDSAAPRLAYAIPIAIGALCTLWRH